MSAVPKKKLCWNCEGNVARQVDNCPYCGVYLHAEELAEEDSTSWNPSYRPSSKTEEIPSPIYQIQQDEEMETSALEEPIENLTSETTKAAQIYPWNHIFTQLKTDVFPTLFLMMGSIFFLFGIVLLLFAQNGTLTLQWQGSYALYFLLVSLPLVGFGWRFLQNLGTNDE